MKKISFMAALLSTVFVCQLGAAQAATLFDALARAYSTSPSLQASRANAAGIDENVAVAKSGYRPEVYLSGDLSRAHNWNDARQNKRYDTENQGVAANVRQSLFSGFQTVNATRAADSAAKAGHAELSDAEQQVLLSASTAYLDVLRDEMIVSLQRNNERLLKRQLDEAEQRFEVGQLTVTDVSQSRARHAQAAASRVGAEGQLEVSKAAYRRIIGAKPDKLEEPVGLDGFLPRNFDEAQKGAATGNYAVRAGKNAYNARVYDVAASKGALWPSVSAAASASKGYNYQEGWVGPDTRNENVQVGLNMTVPLYDAGLSRAKIRQSKYGKWQAHERLVDAQNQAEQEVSSAWETMVANAARLDSVREQIKANEIALEGVSREQALGNRTVIEVLNAYQELLNSNVEEVKAKRDYFVSEMTVLAAMGRLTAKDLGLNVKLYDAEAKYEDTRDKWLSIGIEEE